MAGVRLACVQKSFAGMQVLRDINPDVRDGEFMVFVGPSGCGKSTLQRVIAGLEEITGGELSIGGRVVNEVPPSERGIAMVFQSYALYPHMSLYDNMAFGLKLANMPDSAIASVVHNAARILNIDHLLERKPKDLSGGQRQRSRSVARSPASLRFSCSMSRCRISMRRCGCGCTMNSPCLAGGKRATAGPHCGGRSAAG